MKSQSTKQRRTHAPATATATATSSSSPTSTTTTTSDPTLSTPEPSDTYDDMRGGYTDMQSIAPSNVYAYDGKQAYIQGTTSPQYAGEQLRYGIGMGGQTYSQIVPQASTAATSHLAYPYNNGMPAYYDPSGERARTVSQPYPTSNYPTGNKKPVKVEDEEKRTRRKEQNRLAQQDLRRRRLEHAQYLEQKVTELQSQLQAYTDRNMQLESLYRDLQADNNNLRAAMKGEIPHHQISSGSDAGASAVGGNNTPSPTADAFSFAQQKAGPIQFTRRMSGNGPVDGQVFSAGGHLTVDTRQAAGGSSYSQSFDSNRTSTTPTLTGSSSTYSDASAAPANVARGFVVPGYAQNGQQQSASPHLHTLGLGRPSSGQSDGTLPSMSVLNGNDMDFRGYQN